MLNVLWSFFGRFELHRTHLLESVTKVCMFENGMLK